MKPKPYYIVFVSGDTTMTVHLTKPEALEERKRLKQLGCTHINVRKRCRQPYVSDYHQGGI